MAAVVEIFTPDNEDSEETAEASDAAEGAASFDACLSPDG
jgi:hypothetical protein